MLPMLGLRGNLPGPMRAGQPPGHGGAPAAEGAAQGGRHLPGDRRQEARGGEQALRADAEPGPHVGGDRLGGHGSGRLHGHHEHRISASGLRRLHINMRVLPLALYALP